MDWLSKLQVKRFVKVLKTIYLNISQLIKNDEILIDINFIRFPIVNDIITVIAIYEKVMKKIFIWK